MKYNKNTFQCHGTVKLLQKILDTPDFCTCLVCTDWPRPTVAF